MDTFPLYIKTLSPVHIGNGLEYTPLDYIKSNGRIYFFSPEKVVSILEKAGKEEEFIKWIESMSKKRQELEDKSRSLRGEEQRHFRKNQLYPFNKDFSLKKFAENKSIGDELFKKSSFQRV